MYISQYMNFIEHHFRASWRHNGANFVLPGIIGANPSWNIRHFYFSFVSIALFP